ncbi:MAG: sulfotransferase [Pirellulaceae bacterium]
MLPNFFIAGAPKAGTTSLWRYLNQHPQIYMCEPKEPRYFAFEGTGVGLNGPNDRKCFVKRTLEDYKALFDGARETDAVGEASQWYFYLPNALEAIRKTIPGAKLLVILRDPAERAFSNYLHAWIEEHEPLSSFRDALAAEPMRIKAGWSPRFHYIQKGFYHKQMEECHKIFPASQVRIFLYEDLQTRPQWLLREVFDFLCIDQDHIVDSSARYNESRPPRSRTVANVLNNRSIRKISKIVPDRIRQGLASQFRAYNAAPKPKLSASDRAHLTNVYREDILRLQDVIQRDLTLWLSKETTR